MNHQMRRYIFIDYDNLKAIRFRKIEKVCDKVFIFISAEEDTLPFELVLQMQKFGKNAKWITVDRMDVQDMNYHICFLMGKLHEKISTEIEFAIISNDLSFSGIVAHINADGRKCVRVNGHQSRTSEEETLVDVDVDSFATSSGERNTEVDTEEMSEEQSSNFLANETYNRLMRSGNRPEDIAILRSYIGLGHKNMQSSKVEKVIKAMMDKKQIFVSEGLVKYNF